MLECTRLPSLPASHGISCLFTRHLYTVLRSNLECNIIHTGATCRHIERDTSDTRGQIPIPLDSITSWATWPGRTFQVVAAELASRAGRGGCRMPMVGGNWLSNEGVPTLGMEKGKPGGVKGGGRSSGCETRISFDWRCQFSHWIVMGIPELGSIPASFQKRGSNLQQSSVWGCGSMFPETSTLPRAI